MLYTVDNHNRNSWSVYTLMTCLTTSFSKCQHELLTISLILKLVWNQPTLITKNNFVRTQMFYVIHLPTDQDAILIVSDWQFFESFYCMMHYQQGECILLYHPQDNILDLEGHGSPPLPCWNHSYGLLPPSAFPTVCNKRNYNKNWICIQGHELIYIKIAANSSYIQTIL